MSRLNAEYGLSEYKTFKCMFYNLTQTWNLKLEIECEREASVRTKMEGIDGVLFFVGWSYLITADERRRINYYHFVIIFCFV